MLMCTAYLEGKGNIFPLFCATQVTAFLTLISAPANLLHLFHPLTGKGPFSFPAVLYMHNVPGFFLQLHK